MAESTLINIVATRCKSEEEARFNRWYDETHIPMLMKFKGMKAAARYRVASDNPDYPTYLAIYQFESEEAFRDLRRVRSWRRHGKSSGLLGLTVLISGGGCSINSLKAGAGKF
jgi:hypothetical protein